MQICYYNVIAGIYCAVGNKYDYCTVGNKYDFNLLIQYIQLQVMNLLPPLTYPIAPSELVNDMPRSSIIRDNRTAGELAGASFLGFCRTKVAAEFRTSLVSGNAHHQAQFWCADLVCSGAILEICDSLISVVSRHTGSLNPRLVIYLDEQITNLFNIITTNKSKIGSKYLDETEDIDELLINTKKTKSSLFTETRPTLTSKTAEIRNKYMNYRNNKKVRELLAEMVYVVFSSRKASGQDTMDICGTDEFDNGNMTSRLAAPSADFGTPCLKQNDADEMRIAANEFSYQLSLTQHSPKYNTLTAVYWIEWTLELERRCKMTKTQVDGAPRTHYPVETRYKTLPIWILWDIVQHYAKAKSNGIADKVIASVANLFCFQFTNANARLKKTRHLLYYAVRIFTEHVDFHAPLLTTPIPPDVAESIHTTYAQVAHKLV